MSDLRITVRSTIVFTEARVNALVRSLPRRWMQGVLRVVRDTVRRLSPRDAGAFVKSVYYRTLLRASGVRGIVASSLSDAIVKAIEFGRRAGASMPPAGALLPWMGRHGIADSAEFAVRRTVARRGIPGQHPFERAFRLHAGLLKSQARTLAASFAQGLRHAA